MRTPFLLLLACLLLLSPPVVRAQQKPEPIVTDFKAQPLYRAASLTWKVQGRFERPVTFQILRSDTFVEGPYTEIAVLQSTPAKASYEYVDKSVGTEAKYYYKLIIKETGEALGPIPTRPYFSPPATHLPSPPKYG